MSAAPSVRSTTEAEDGLRWRRNEPSSGQHDMHARGLDAAHQLDGARKLALDGAHPRDFLHEGSEAERAELVEQLVARVGVGRQALLGQHHAGLRGLPVRHQHRRAVRTHVEVDAGFAQRRADTSDVGAMRPE